MDRTATETRLQIALGNIVALNAAVAALFRVAPEKAALSEALEEFDGMSIEIIRMMELRHSGSGETMQDTYLQQMAGFRQLLVSDSAPPR